MTEAVVCGDTSLNCSDFVNQLKVWKSVSIEAQDILFSKNCTEPDRHNNCVCCKNNHNTCSCFFSNIKVGGDGHRSILQLQYEGMSELITPVPATAYSDATSEENIHKNRDKSILPGLTFYSLYL